MPEDKKIQSDELPQKVKKNLTQQPEEYIDKSNLKKDEGDLAKRPPGDSAGENREAS